MARLMAASDGSGVEQPRSESPLVAMKATSIRRSRTIRMAKSSTVASVRGRTRPPARMTVTPGSGARRIASAMSFVTTVRLRPGGNDSAMAEVVVPASMMTDPSTSGR